MNKNQKKWLIISIVIIIILALGLGLGLGLGLKETDTYDYFNKSFSSPTYFITYGDKRFVNSKNRIINEARKTGWFDDCKAFGPKDLQKLIPANNTKVFNVLKKPRGGGYWLWKPLIIKDVLSRMKMNDILLYTDAGCTFRISKSGINSWWKSKLENLKNQPVNAIQYTKPNKEWCRMDAAQYVLKDSDSIQKYMNEKQLEANRILIRKTPVSVSFFDEFAYLALTRPDLFTDNPSSIPNHPEFKEHRHDQSFLSMLMFKYGFKGSPNWENFLSATRIRC